MNDNGKRYWLNVTLHTWSLIDRGTNSYVVGMLHRDQPVMTALTPDNSVVKFSEAAKRRWPELWSRAAGLA
jgi:hypothetical protein